MIRFVIPYLLYSAAAIFCILLQSAFFAHLEIFNAKPDLLLLLVLMSGLKSDWKNGVAVGLLVGFWIDLFNAGYFGMNMVVYALMGALCGLVGAKFPNRTYEGYFFSAVMASLLSGLLSVALFHLLGVEIPVWQSIIGVVLPMTFYTSLLAFFGLPLVWLYRRISGRKIGRIDLIGNGVVLVRGDEKVDLKKLAARRREAAARKRYDRRHRNQHGHHSSQEHHHRDHQNHRSRRTAERGSSTANRGSRQGTTGRRPNEERRMQKKRPVEKKPRSYPRRRPQKHSGSRSK